MNGCLLLYTRSSKPHGVCPYCQSVSRKVHSRYIRRLQFLPAFGKNVILCFQARKFFCHNKECRYKTFAEQPGNEVKFNEVKRLQKEGKGIKETASLLGIARQNVRKYLSLESFPVPKGKESRDMIIISTGGMSRSSMHVESVLIRYVWIFGPWDSRSARLLSITISGILLTVIVDIARQSTGQICKGLLMNPRKKKRRLPCLL